MNEKNKLSKYRSNSAKSYDVLCVCASQSLSLSVSLEKVQRVMVIVYFAHCVRVCAECASSTSSRVHNKDGDDFRIRFSKTFSVTHLCFQTKSIAAYDAKRFIIVLRRSIPCENA